MNEIEFIDYSDFFNKKIKAYQILFDKSLESLTLEKFRKHIIDKLSIDINYIAIPNQIHSNKIKWVNSNGCFNNTDGLITKNKKIILSLRTADCIPIFLYDQKYNIKGLVHSGWRGTKDKIINNAIKSMIRKGSKLSDIYVLLGASIHKCCYEIGEDLVKYFNKNCIYNNNKKTYLSLQEQIQLDLGRLNINDTNIYIDNRCTFMEDRLSSYRRDKEKAGKMISLFGDF